MTLKMVATSALNVKAVQKSAGSDTDVQIVRYIPLSLFPSGKANDGHVVLDLTLKLKTCKIQCLLW